MGKAVFGMFQGPFVRDWAVAKGDGSRFGDVDIARAGCMASGYLSSGVTLGGGPLACADCQGRWRVHGQNGSGLSYCMLDKLGRQRLSATFEGSGGRSREGWD